MLIKDGKLVPRSSRILPGHPRPRKNSLERPDRHVERHAMDEAYGPRFSDGHRMLYLQPDMAAFARRRSWLHSAPGEAWLYSAAPRSLARIAQRRSDPRQGKGLRDSIHAPEDPQDLPLSSNVRLFGPLGMTTATMEPDEHGSLVGLLLLYVCIRARLGPLTDSRCKTGRLAGTNNCCPRLRRHDGEPRCRLPRPVRPRAKPALGIGPRHARREPPTPLRHPARLPSGCPATTARTSPVIKSRQLVIVRLGLTPTPPLLRAHPW